MAFYDGDYHAELQTEGGSETAFGAKYRRYADTLKKYLGSGRVVDVGCSTGLLVRILRDRGYEAEGIELNPQSAEWGRAHYDVTIHTEPLERCPYAPESLDGLLMTDVLEHASHPLKFLLEARQLLMPGGVLLVIFPDIRSLESRYWHFLSRLFQRDGLWRNCHIPLHVWEFTRPTAEVCFRSAGFRVLEFRRTQPIPESYKGSLALRLLELPTRFLCWPLFRDWLGTQMEFVIQKTSDASRIPD
jgi:SAM-dependent methyltransferase